MKTALELKKYSIKAKLLFTVLTMIASFFFIRSNAQACLPTTASDTLSINKVQAFILNGGDLHRNSSNAGYEVPKGSGLNSIYASGMWIGGIDLGGNLKMAAQTYRQSGNDFWAGPLDTTNASTSLSGCNKYDKIWKLNRYDIERFKYEWAVGTVQSGTYAPSADILSWPGSGTPPYAKTLAPYVDVNSNGIYDPLHGGDYPVIKGDQMLYWIFNDVGNIHTETGGKALGIEVHASAYAVSCPTAGDSERVMNYTTFYHYEIFNRSPYLIDSTFIGYWQDADLGCSADDFAGSSPVGNYMVVLNGDSVDCGSTGYGAKPPMLSTIILNGPPADNNDGADNDNDGVIDEPNEKCLMNGMVVYKNINGPNGNPIGATHYYNYLRSKWGDGSAMPRFANPIFPYDTTMWDSLVAPMDIRTLVTSGPFTFFPGQKFEYDFAIVWSRDTLHPYRSPWGLIINRKDNQTIREWFAAGNFPACQRYLAVGPENEFANSVTIFPNPASDLITISYPAPTKNLQIEIIDIIGKKVAETMQKQINVSHLPPGLYLLRITDGDQQLTKRFVKE